MIDKTLDVDSASPREHKPLNVVGIGASAGGLEAFTQLLSNLPERTGMAFVLVQHLEPTHSSHLVDILSKVTVLPVVEVEEGMKVAADRIYVIPPNNNMALEKGVLRLTPRGESRGAYLPIDFFLHSLAQERQMHSMGVVLSGTGSDGTLGLADIKAAGGLTFAQDEASCKFPAMPLSAVSGGFVDIVLPPAEIARELARMGGHPYLESSTHDDSGALFSGCDDDFARLIVLLRTSSGVDFAQYRDSTLKRRILRRMALVKLDTLPEYVRMLEENPVELKSLNKDILIHVTRFFRDPNVFESLTESVLPAIQKSKSPGESIRIWVAGCATGEEAYSLAIVLCEFQDAQASRLELRIFASDINESPSLERARAGLYPLNIEHDVSPDRLRRFFVKEDGGYRINKELRSMCIFAKHDLTADPPFARLDLISCRNVLIYLSAPLQRRIIPAFHYALNPGGFLVLGNSETIGRDTDLFGPVDAEQKVYSRKMAAVRLPILSPKGPQQGIPGKPRPNPRTPNALDFQQAADRLVLRKFVPPGVLVNKDMDVLQFRGRTSPFLEPPTGGTSLNLDKMAQEGFSLELRNAIRECEKTDILVERRDVKVLDGRLIRKITLQVHPIKPPDASETCFLVLFEESADPASLTALAANRTQRGPHEDEEVALLRHGLAAAREYVQTIREQCDAVTEELKSTNEEMESSNEEMQSTNEELETAKEELQSANEELATMNEELLTRNVEQGRLNDDLHNLIETVQIPIIMLGRDLRIRRFTPAAGVMLRLGEADIGRPVGNVKSVIPGLDLEKLVTQVVASQKPVSMEMRDQEGRWLALKISPYRSSQNKIDGAVVVLLDIDENKRVQQRLQESGDYARSIVDTVREPLLILEEDLRIRSANLSYYRLFGTKPQDTEGLPLEDVAGGVLRIPALLSLLTPADPTDPVNGNGFENFEASPHLPQGQTTLALNARRFLQSDGRSGMTLLAIQDITTRRRAERDLRLLKYFSDQSPNPFYLMDSQAKLTYVNRSAFLRLGYTEAELLSLTLLQIEPACTSECFDSLFKRVHVSPIPLFETEHAAKDGKRFPVECSVTGVDFEGQEFILMVARDITERKSAEEALLQSEEKLRQSQRMEAIGKLAGGIAHDFNNLLTAINGYSALCLAEAPEEGDMHDYLEEISKAGERAASLTRQLLAYSRKQLLAPKIINLNVVVTNMQSMLSRLIGSHFNISLSLDDSLGLVKADPGQVEQVLINLVLNARDALPQGGAITLKTRNVEWDGDYSTVLPMAPKGAYVLLSVGDNGVGMSPELLNNIFEPFYTTKGLGMGTGLGLSVVQGIVSQSEGYIAVKSVPGEGSEFKIYLPRDYARETQAPAKAAGLGLHYRGIETILLVEDEQTVRNFTRKILEMQGYSVLEADNGQSAKLVEEQHRDTKIHILVSDMVMPGMNGRELADWFLAIRPEARVLLMSGYTEDFVFDANDESGREARFIQKPFTPVALVKAVRESLDLATSSGE